MATLSYSFEVVGKNLIDQALASIERRIVQHDRFVARTLGAGRAGRTSAGSSAARLSTAGRAAASEEAKVLREQQRQADYYHRARLASARQRHQEELKAAKVEARTREQEEKRASRAVDRERRALARAQQQETGRIVRDEERARLSGRRAGVQQARALARQEVRAKAQFSEESSEFRRAAFGGAGRGVARVASAVGRTGAALLGIGGSVLAASSVSQFNQLDETSRRLAIGGRGFGEAGRDPEALRKQFVNTAIETGTAPEDVAAGAAAFVAKTGDLGTATKNMKVFSTVAMAAGASVEDVAAAAADLSTKMDISSVEDMSKAFAVLIAQGKAGAFELKNLAVEAPEILAGAASVGITGTEGMKQLGGLLQIARSSTGSAAETTTAVGTMFRQMGARSADIQDGSAFSSGRKVSVFEDDDATKPMRNFRDVLADVLVASQGNIVELNDIFDVRGIKAINPLVKTFRETRQAAVKGGASGGEADKKAREAVKQQLEKAADVQSNYSEVVRDANDAMKSNSVRLQVLETELKSAIAQSLVPELMRLLPQITRLVPAVGAAVNQFVTLASVVADNPLAGIGTLITGYVAAELGKQALADAASLALTKGLGGAFAKGGLVFGTLVASISLAKLMVETWTQEAERKVGAAAKQGEEIREKARQELTTTGTLSMETRTELEQLGVTEQERLKQSAQHFKDQDSKGTLGRSADFVERLWEGATGGQHDMQEAATLMETGSNPEYMRGAAETQNLLQLMKQFGEEQAAAIIKAGEKLEDAAAELKKGGGGQMPPRGNGPSPVK
jgi:hypothetical protein